MDLWVGTQAQAVHRETSPYHGTLVSLTGGWLLDIYQRAIVTACSPLVALLDGVALEVARPCPEAAYGHELTRDGNDIAADQHEGIIGVPDSSPGPVAAYLCPKTQDHERCLTEES